ncbi:MAG: sulfatase [Defluviitaleaceae bacterium]|nr:sulfatase [Defluviitaleaceae bacterium]
MRILFIDIDTLRPDHMGCYGYYRDTTPNIDEIASEALVFDRYYCPDAPCLPSRAALLTGMYGIRSGIVGHGGTAADKRPAGRRRSFSDTGDHENLINIFRNAGMKTASISTFAERHSAWWWNAGFNETYNVGGGGMESGEEVIPVALDWLDKNKNATDWFLHLHIWDPHTPYRAPESFGDPFKNAPFETWITEEIFAEHLRKAGPHSLLDLAGLSDHFDPNYPRYPGQITEYGKLRELFDGYDTGVRYADYLIGQVIGALKARGAYEDTAIIITSDHGENMGEQGIYAEHGTADEITCRIPMIIKWPGGDCGRDSGLRLNIDFAPTAAELLGRRAYSNWDGESFAGIINGKNAGPGRRAVVLSQQAHVCQRSARFGDWLYVRTLRDGFRLLDDEMLFDITNDPHERFDLKGERPDVCAEGAKIILDWQEKMLKKNVGISATDPMWTVMNEGGPLHAHDGGLDGYVKRLEESGRGEAARALAQKYKAGR